MSEVSLSGKGHLAGKPKPYVVLMQPDNLRVIALDLGSHCGWATQQLGRVIESGVQHFTVAKGESPGMRFLRFNKWFNELLDLIHPDVVVYEHVYGVPGPALELMLGMATRVMENCARAGVQYTGYNPSTVKKRVLGHGKAPKERVIEFASRYVDRKIVDDNEADAIALLSLAKDDYVV